MSATYQQVLAAAVEQYVAEEERARRRNRRIWAMILERRKLKITLNNTAPGRIRKDLLEAWAAAMRQNASWVAGGDHGSVTLLECPRCAYDPEWKGFPQPLFTDISGAPVMFDALDDEDVHGLSERHIEQCNGCGLILAESYFCPGPGGWPAGRRATLHLIEPEK